MLWAINITNRIMPSHAVLAEGMSNLFNSFKFDVVTIAFTHCDQLEEDVAIPEEIAEDWIVC